jgi:methylglutaconyl-CoA hydratase
MSTLTIARGPVTTVTLNRPDVRNAFNEALIAELTDWATSVPADGSVRVAVLQGAGSVFSAGADVQWMAKMVDYSQEQNLADAQVAASMFLALDSIPVPLIGRIHGAAIGGGSGLAAVCDVVIAADDAVFGFTETTLGILPAMISLETSDWSMTSRRRTGSTSRLNDTCSSSGRPRRRRSPRRSAFSATWPVIGRRT